MLVVTLNCMILLNLGMKGVVGKREVRYMISKNKPYFTARYNAAQTSIIPAPPPFVKYNIFLSFITNEQILLKYTPFYNGMILYKELVALYNFGLTIIY